ncbi:2-C-methyl-D-erythritol 4-phosphate cytidylyltransferase [Halochromatium sp.]
MKAAPKHWVVLPAAGAGRRFGSAVPKQYLPLGDRRVIEHSIAVFIEHPLIAGCIVALSPGDEWWQETAYVDHPAVVRVPGGAERFDSVANALAALANQAAADDWVLVHDAARPCLTTADLDRLLAALIDEPVGALLAVPMHDTVKSAEEAFGARVERTLPRQQLWRAFTPQAFRLGQLRDALAYCRAERMAITDDASAMEQLGLRPLLIEGRADNIKITRPEDLPLAEFFLEQQRRQEQR